MHKQTTIQFANSKVKSLNLLHFYFSVPAQNWKIKYVFCF